MAETIRRLDAERDNVQEGWFKCEGTCGHEIRLQGIYAKQANKRLAYDRKVLCKDCDTIFGFPAAETRLIDRGPMIPRISDYGEWG